jgi:hypothetical protein
MAGQDVIIRTSADSKLAAAVRNAVVAFEIDEFDADLRSGWSVVLVGHARRVSDPQELKTFRELPLHLWTPDRRDDFIRITPEIVTGRRILAPLAP